MPTPIQGNRDANALIGNMTSGRGQTPSPIAGSKGMFGAFGLQLQGWFASLGNLASQIGVTNLPFLGSPAAPASGGQASQTAGTEKAKETPGTTITVEDPKEKLFDAMRAAGHDVKKENITDQMAEDWKEGKVKLAQLADKIDKAEKAKEEKAAKARAEEEATKQKQFADGVARAGEGDASRTDGGRPEVPGSPSAPVPNAAAGTALA